MKHILLLPLASLLCASAASAVEINDDLFLEAKVGLYSDYRTRGVSQTQNDPALQGSATLIHSSGWYAGAWSSNVDFGDGIDTRQEIDLYAGYFWQISDDASLDLSYIKYLYPRHSGFDYDEYHAELSAYGMFLGGNYADDMGGDQSYLYSYLGYRTELPAELGLEVRYGRVDYKDPVFFTANGGERESYREWQIEVSRAFKGLDWSLGYVDTSLGKDECASFNGFDDVCSATLVVGVSKTF
ncbi:TorF family putative porin [Stutzerimonas stutzeri]|uniref:TorF family putative porin n=1 Tax=Stutzerimonas stutzeri TaxID=316 RepID=UPI001C2EE430|nr:TorF family putative porin [Stutzerimonas stutzeri]